MAILASVVFLFCVFVNGWTAPSGDNAETYLRLPAIQEEEYHEISPELLDVYKDFELLNRLEKGNVTDQRESRGFLSKLYFLTGLKLGSLLTSSGTIAASNSIRILGKVLNSAISVSYGSDGGLIQPVPGIDETGFGIPEVEPEIPVVETVPAALTEPKSESSNLKLNTDNEKDSTTDFKKTFLKGHNERVEHLNKVIEGNFRTPRFN